MPNRPRRSVIRSGRVAAVALMLVWGMPELAGAGGGTAQSSSLRAERTVEFRTGKPLDLAVTVGPVKVSSVEFSNLGRGYGRGGLADRLRAATGASDASTTLRARFPAENPSADEWQVTFSLELVDRGGKTIERVTRRSSWEGEARAFDFDFEILEYVVPMIARVNLRLEARLE